MLSKLPILTVTPVALSAALSKWILTSSLLTASTYSTDGPSVSYEVLTAINDFEEPAAVFPYKSFTLLLQEYMLY